MKKITLTLLILVPFFTEAKAATNAAPYRDICSDINAAISTGTTHQFCRDILTSYSGLPPMAPSICIAAADRFHMDPDNASSYCHNQFKELRMESEHEQTLNLRPATVHFAPLRMRQSQVAQQCDEKFMCTFNSELSLPEHQDLLQRLSLYGPPVAVASINLSPEKCNCLEESVEKSHQALNIGNIESALNLERRRINDLIFNAVGKKLINDFAANLEDLNFFNTNNVDAIGGNQAKAQVSCNEFSSFQNAIMDKCRRNGIQASVATERMTTLMNAFGDLGKNVDAQTLFNKLTSDIMTYRVDSSKVFPGRRPTFTRQEYDRFRFGRLRQQPEVAFVNDIIDLLMDDDDLGPQLISDMQSGKAPGHAFSIVLKDRSNKKARKILDRYLKRHRDSTFHHNMIAALNSDVPEAFDNYLLDTINTATDVHPGLKAIFKDKDVFFATREKMHSTGSHSMLNTLDATPGALVNFFQERCDKLKRDFAEAACVPNDDLISRTDRNDLAELLSTVENLNLPLSELLLCRMPPEQMQRSIFTRLAVKPHDRINQADYFLTKVDPENASASGFSQVAMRFATGDEKTYRALSAISASGDAFRKPSAEIAAQMTETMTPTTVAPETTLASLNEILPRTQEVDRSLQDPMQSNYLAPIAAPASATNETAATAARETNPRNLLRDFLANKENSEEIERHLNNTRPEDHAELARLREELQRSQSRIQELLQESERNKLDNLRADYERLEREVNRSPSEERRNIPAGEHETSEAEVRTASVLAPPPGSTRTPDAGGVTSGGTTSTSTGGGAAGSAISRAIASEESNISPSGQAAPAIVIESAKIQSNSAEGRAKISEEVIDYLQNSSPDLNTLMQLKESGIIIKYRVVENGEEVQKEMRVSYSDLSPEARQILEQKLQREEQLVALERAKRAYSYSALKQLLGLQAQTEQR